MGAFRGTRQQQPPFPQRPRTASCRTAKRACCSRPCAHAEETIAIYDGDTTDHAALRACGGTPSPSLNTPSASHGPARMWREPNPCRPQPEHGSNHTVAQHPEIYTEITFTFNRLPFWAQGRRCNVLLHICCNDLLHPYSAATARRPHPHHPAGVRHSRPYHFV